MSLFIPPFGFLEPAEFAVPWLLFPLPRPHRSYRLFRPRRSRSAASGRAACSTRSAALAAPAQRSCAGSKKSPAPISSASRRSLRDLTKFENILTTTVAQCSGEASSACPILKSLHGAPRRDVVMAPGTDDPEVGPKNCAENCPIIAPHRKPHAKADSRSEGIRTAQRPSG
jgi:hypothetical protein